MDVETKRAAGSPVAKFSADRQPPRAAQTALASSTRASRDHYDYVSAASVQEHKDTLYPFMSGMAGDASPATSIFRGHLSPGGAMGLDGPLGAKGPLGEHGPIQGSNDWMSKMPEISKWLSSAFLNKVAGPLSALGPLGPVGPLGNYNALDWMAPGTHEMKSGGALSAVGPLGPLGPLGVLGPLGPNGPHGFQMKDGNFVDGDGKVVRSVRVPFGGSSHDYELFEAYPEDRAEKMTDNDTSFVASGTIASKGEKDTYKFTSNADQWVTLNVVPTADATNGKYDDVNLEVLDGTGRLLTQSKLKNMADWVSIRVPAGTDLQARVSLGDKASGGAAPYRLFVTGSTDQFDRVDDIGDQLQKTN